jgi:hypothetical protein
MTNRDQVTKTLKAYSAQHGHPAMRELLEAKAGVSAVSEIPEDKLADVEQAAGEGASSGVTEINPTAIYAKWNSAGSAGRRSSGD